MYGINSGTGNAGYFDINNTSNASFAVFATTNGSGDAVYGINSGTGYAGYFDVANSSNANSAVYGQTNGSGNAVFGSTTGTGSAGYFNINNTSNSNPAVYGNTNGTGNAGYFNISNGTSEGAAVYALTNGGSGGAAVEGIATGTGYAGLFEISNASNANDAVYGNTNGSGDAGFFAISSASNSNDAVYGYTAGTGYAGYFIGKVNITGAMTAGSKSFLIDHPLDPLNKTLRHNCVESPENLCLYRGKVTLDAEGKATVKMPDYFTALTKANEATVNLTPIGKKWFGVSYDWNSDWNEFTVYGDPGKEVSYTVYADRNDPVMKQLYKPVEEDKGAGNICNKGELLYPEAYGYPKEMGKDYKKMKEQEEKSMQVNKDQK
jgi:hypothetical protein